MLATIRTAAARYGMSAELTGVAARRPSLNGTKQRQSPASAQWRAANAATLPDWAPARKFSITRLRPGYDQEQVDAFVSASVPPPVNTTSLSRLFETRSSA